MLSSLLLTVLLSSTAARKRSIPEDLSLAGSLQPIASGGLHRQCGRYGHMNKHNPFFSWRFGARAGILAGCVAAVSMTTAAHESSLLKPLNSIPTELAGWKSAGDGPPRLTFSRSCVQPATCLARTGRTEDTSNYPRSLQPARGADRRCIPRLIVSPVPVGGSGGGCGPVGGEGARVQNKQSAHP